MNTSKCKFNDSGKCGSSRGIEEVYSVLNLDRDCKNHLKSLKLLYQYEEWPVNEKELIESRGGCSLLDEDFICSYHRNNLSAFWRNSLKCFLDVFTLILDSGFNCYILLSAKKSYEI